MVLLMLSTYSPRSRLVASVSLAILILGCMAPFAGAQEDSLDQEVERSGETSDATNSNAASKPSRQKLAQESDSPGDTDAENSAGSESATRVVSRASVLVGSLTVFLLAVFVGFEVITKVPPTLHTPLMSGSNAISGITVVGAMLTAGGAAVGFGSVLGMFAVILATVNVIGGFLVTHRMLMMFKKK